MDDRAAWRGQHPEEAQGSYEPVPEWVKRANILSENLQLNKHKLNVFAFYMCIQNSQFDKYLYFHCTKKETLLTKDATILQTHKNSLNLIGAVHD